ncbi:hypothetical protein [Thioclava atlantica]|uniref:Uncharacterized protein n=1 Tax=Thioclava atlantica TaxID=1317124 RepID=A0A085TZI1_9RHOB|nr:hypothetical protein [Thioclava atlantica]KFE36128.1 hypothetical protein DW2_05845 [Thioclava atlantica]
MTDVPASLKTFLTEEQIAELPDQRGVRAWAFEPYLELHHQAANAALAPVLDSLREHWLQGFQRKPNSVEQGRFVGCLRVLLLNLMRVRTVDEGLTVGISSSKGPLQAEVRYRPAFMSVQYHVRALKLLQERGLVCMVKAGHRQDGYGETARYALTEAACTLLLLSGIATRDFTIGRRDEVIRLKDTEGRLTRYSDTPETQAMRTNLRRLNDLLEGTDIALTRSAHALIDFDDKYSGQRTDLYRVFNNRSFAQGGRFYGGWWQHAKRYVRPFITIDGQPTVEADFKGLHPAILFAKSGLDIPPDPYSLVPGIADNEMLRDHAKTTFLALLNADSTTKEPRNFDSAAHGMTAEAFRQRVKDAFPMLPGIFGTGIGRCLQREDSDMAEKIMLHFADRGMPVLPVHDSFIIAADHKDELIRVMEAVFHARYGQMPKITLKLSA